MHNHDERQLGSLFGKPDWKLKVLCTLDTCDTYTTVQ